MTRDEAMISKSETIPKLLAVYEAAKEYRAVMTSDNYDFLIAPAVGIILDKAIQDLEE